MNELSSMFSSCDMVRSARKSRDPLSPLLLVVRVIHVHNIKSLTFSAHATFVNLGVPRSSTVLERYERSKEATFLSEDRLLRAYDGWLVRLQRFAHVFMLPDHPNLGSIEELGFGYRSIVAQFLILPG